jgi:hypothetical protein
MDIQHHFILVISDTMTRKIACFESEIILYCCFACKIFRSGKYSPRSAINVAEIGVGRHSKCTLLLSDFNPAEIAQPFIVKFSVSSFMKTCTTILQMLMVCRRTDGQRFQ